jgi:prepilin-type N-terminal cleavage/methylation domain-containing protein
MRTRRRSGFTLLEVVLVMAIIIIFAAISYPAIDAMYAGARVEGASDAVRAAWADAAGHAVNEGRAYRFAIVPGKGNLRVAPDGAEFWNGEGGTANADPDNPAYILQSSLPKGMVFPDESGNVPQVAVNDSSLPDDNVPVGSWVTWVTFLPDGTAQDDAEVFLQYPGTRPITLRLRALTGTTTVLRGEE